MSSFLYSILAFIFAIGLLTSIHEFGHFWVARLFGVKVLRFSVGFGKSLLTWHDKSGTEYVVAAIPLGGYVKMLDQNEGVVAPNELYRAFNNKPVAVRMAVIAAGPVFNIIFAILAYWCVFMLGVTSLVPVLGDPPKGSVAAVAGLKSGQEITAINSQAVNSWEDIAVALMGSMGESNFINITVQNQGTNQSSVHALNLSNWSLEDKDENLIKNLGLEPIDPIVPTIGAIQPDLPAAKAGLEVGDQIISIDGIATPTRTAVLETLRDKYERAVHVIVKRNEQEQSILLTPNKKLLEGGAVTGYIGVQFADIPWPLDLIRIQHFTPWHALQKAVARTQEYSVLTIKLLGKMISGQMSLQHVAGPISIAKFAGRTAESGISYFLGFLALVSISLGVLNMLPIPILDGGHFLFCLIELVSGKRLSDRAISLSYTMGYAILGGFMTLALYNDVVRILQ